MNDATPQTYTLDILAEITGVSTQTIVQYQEHGLIRPDFDDETVRALRRIEHLRETCELNLAGLKLLTSLLEEVEQLRAELRTLR
jgi:DNA-binding transcriptional MerR regulator